MIDAKPRPVSSPTHRPGSIGWIKGITLDLLSSPVVSISAPGGKDRRSVRLVLEDGRAVIATRRESIAKAEHEVSVLMALGADGAPVPEVLGFHDGLLLQSDAGRNRLSYAMQNADDAERVTLARAAIAGLEACREAAESQPAFLAELPGLGTRPGWAEEFVSRAVFLSGDLKIAVPDIDADALAAALAYRPERFTRWDARLGNAAVQADGRVVWYDWDLCGRRAGVEDLSWLVSDNYWEFDRDVTEFLLSDVVSEPDLGHLVRRMAVMIAIGRLAKIRERVASDGWSDPVEALRMDRLGAVPELVENLCQRMADLCDDDPVMSGFTGWFSAVSDALRGMR